VKNRLQFYNNVGGGANVALNQFQAFSLLLESHQWLSTGNLELAKVVKEEAERMIERNENMIVITTIKGGHK
jgi:hypothetical protein